MPKLTKRARVPAETAAKILAFIRRGNTIETAAICSGIHKDTFYDWMKRGRKGEAGYKEFADQVDMAVQQATALMVDTLRTIASDQNKLAAMKAVEFWLTRRGGPEWQPPAKSTIITGPGGGPVQVDDIKRMRALPDDELREIAEGKA